MSRSDLSEKSHYAHTRMTKMDGCLLIQKIKLSRGGGVWGGRKIHHRSTEQHAFLHNGSHSRRRAVRRSTGHCIVYHEVSAECKSRMVQIGLNQWPPIQDGVGVQ